MRTRASVTTTVIQVIEVFNRLDNSDIAYESKEDLKRAAKLLEAVLQDGTLDDETLKNQVDCIIVGAVIASMGRHAAKYNTSYERYHLYSASPSEICRTTGQLRDAEFYYEIGRCALIEKTLPFTGNFDDFKYLARGFQYNESHPNGRMTNGMRPIFPQLNAAFDPGYFDAYGLNTNPMTVDATEINRVGTAEYLVAVSERRARDEATRLNRKWYQPFSLKDVDGHEKIERRAELEARIAAEEKAYSKRLWTLRGYTLLSYLVAPFTLFISLAVTLPWLKREYEALQTDYDNRPWVKLEFPVGMYSEMRAVRQSIKDAFPETASIESKPHKVCIALDANGREIRTYSDNHRGVAKVIMLCDKAQAKRWSLGFLETVTAETYQQTKEESVALQQLPQLRR